MTTTIVVQVDTRDIDSWRDDLWKNITEAVDKTAFQSEAIMKNKVPVDTGALKASIYTRTSKTNTGASNIGVARAINSDITVIPKLEGFSEPLTADVAVGVEHGYFVNFGAYSKPGTFFVENTRLETKPIFIDNVIKAIRSTRP